MSSSKTILLPIYNGIRAKNFFRNDSYRALVSDPNIRLVIIIPPSKLEYYRKEYPEKNVVFEPLNIISEPKFGRILGVIALTLLNTDTIRAKQWLEYVRYHKFLKFILKRIINRVLGPLGFINRPIIRFLDRFVALDPGVARLFTKYNPDLVIVPDIVFPPDRVVLRAAKRLGYYVVGMIRSWDNITSKGVIQILPDKLIVHTTIMKQEAIKYAGMPEKDIAITGIPHYDLFFKSLKSPLKGREEFLRSLGIDPKKRILLCAPFNYEYTGSAEIIINELTRAIDEGRLPKDLHIIVRYRPATPEISSSKIRPSPHLTFTNPCEHYFAVQNLQSPSEDWEFSQKDLELLVNTLQHSDVVLNYMSTLSIDAAIFDRPVINLRFDADEKTPPHHKIGIFVRYLHYKTVEASGGVKLVWNMEEMIRAINAYLENPKLDKEGRDRLIREQVEFTDGQAGRRTAEYIKQVLRSEPLQWRMPPKA